MLFIGLNEDMGRNLVVVVVVVVFHERWINYVNFCAPLFKIILNMIKVEKCCCCCVITHD